MWGLTINDKHTFDDFGLCCLSCTLDPPEPRLYTIDIPGADGVLDATAARGRVTYKNRTLTAEFDCVYESRTSYDTACAVLNTAHHGRLVELLTDSDPQHVLTGRAAWEHTVDGLAATHTLTVDCQPYRMALFPTEKNVCLDRRGAAHSAFERTESRDSGICDGRSRHDRENSVRRTVYHHEDRRLYHPGDLSQRGREHLYAERHGHDDDSLPRGGAVICTASPVTV